MMAAALREGEMESNWFADMFFRATLSEIEYRYWLESEAGRIVRNRTLGQRAAHFLMWPVYLVEGLLGVIAGLFHGRHGQPMRLPSEFMIGHRATPVIHMTQPQLARGVIGAEGRQFFWLVVLIATSLVLGLIALVALSKWRGGDGFLLLVVGSVVVLVFGTILAGIGKCFYNARENMVRYKRAAATLHFDGQAHGQSQIVPLRSDDDHA